MKRVALLVCLAGLLFAAITAYSQPSDPPDSGAPSPRMGRGARWGHMEPEQRRKYVEQFRLLKLLEILDLKEDQEAKFIESFRAMRRQQREIEQNRTEIMKNLSADLEKNGVDDARITNATDKLFALEDRRREAMRGFLTKARAFLTPEQVGRLILFQERFELELLERVRECWDRTPPARPSQEKP